VCNDPQPLPSCIPPLRQHESLLLLLVDQPILEWPQKNSHHDDLHKKQSDEDLDVVGDVVVDVVRGVVVRGVVVDDVVRGVVVGGVVVDSVVVVDDVVVGVVDERTLVGVVHHKNA